MSKEEYASYPSTISVREVDVTDLVGTKDRFVIVTTILDSEKQTKSDLAEIFKRRWGIELALRDVKTTMGLEHINANSPEMIEKDLWACVIGYNEIRWYMGNAAAIANRNIESVSFSTANNVVIANQSNLLNTKDLNKLRAQMFYQILQCPVGNRPNRVEPRAVKKRPKPREKLNEPRKEWKRKRLA